MKFFKSKTIFKNVVNKKPKKIKIIILALLFIVVVFCGVNIVFADSGNSQIKNEIDQAVNDQLGSVDFGEIDSVLGQIDNNFLFKGSSFKQIVNGILNGEFFNNYDSLFHSIISLVFNNVLKHIPLFLMIIAIALFTQLLINFKGEKFDSGIVNVINIVSLISVIVLVISIFKDVFQSTYKTINLMEQQTEILFPVLLTFLASVGGVVSVGIYKPIVAVLSTLISFLFSKFVYPIFLFAFVLAILNRVSLNFKLKKLFDFVNSLFKWVVGFIFTMFSAFLTVQGISAGRYDQVSIKTTRFAIKSYIPIVGSYLSDGLDIVVLGSTLIKNSVGLGGIIVIIATVFSPVITIIALKLLFQFVSSIVDILGDSKIAEVLDDCSKLMVYPIVIILSVAFMYIISMGLIVCTANII